MAKSKEELEENAIKNQSNKKTGKEIAKDNKR